MSVPMKCSTAPRCASCASTPTANAEIKAPAHRRGPWRALARPNRRTLRHALDIRVPISRPPMGGRAADQPGEINTSLENPRRRVKADLALTTISDLTGAVGPGQSEAHDQFRHLPSHAVAVHAPLAGNLLARRRHRAGRRDAGLQQRVARRASLLDLRLPLASRAAGDLSGREDD